MRFENERLVVLVETKNKFSIWDKSKIQAQLQDYVRFEKNYSNKKIVANVPISIKVIVKIFSWMQEIKIEPNRTKNTIPNKQEQGVSMESEKNEIYGLLQEHVEQAIVRLNGGTDDGLQ